MLRSTCLWTIHAVCFAALPCTVAHAQQATVSTGFQNSADSFFERTGTQFGFNIPGGRPSPGSSSVVGLTPGGAFTPDGSLRFRQGGPVAVPFGGFDPAAEGSLGLQFGGRGGRASLGIFGGQGSSRTSIAQSTSVTMPSGGAAYISDTSQRPFVTGFIPVVGGGFGGSTNANFGLPVPLTAPGPSVLSERLERLRMEKLSPGSQTGARLSAAGKQDQTAVPGQGVGRKFDSARESSAGRPANSIAEIRRRQANQQDFIDQQALESLQLARRAAREGKPALARHHYQQAASRSSAEIQAQALAGVRAVSGSRLAATPSKNSRSAPPRPTEPDPTNPFGAKLTPYSPAR